MCKILIVEDDEDIQALYNEILKSEGYEIVQVMDGNKAYNSFLEQMPELVIMDWMMPGVDGIEISKNIKSTEDSDYTYIIMVTAKVGKESQLISLEIVDDYLEKPIDIDILKSRLKVGQRFVEAMKQQKSLLKEKQKLLKDLEIERNSLEIKVEERTHQIAEKNKLLDKKNKSYEDELMIARSIQQNFIPKDSPLMENIHITGKYMPVGYVGGDLIDFIKITREKIGILISDVSGHSVASSLITSMVKISFSGSNDLIDNPKEMFESLNKTLLGKISTHFVTAAYAVIDVKKKVMRLSVAGHPFPIYINRKKNEFKTFSGGGTILGVFPDAEYDYTDINLEEGDRLLFYTDGIIESFNPKKEAFGEKRLRDLMQNQTSLNSEEIVNCLISEIKDFTVSGKFTDDIALITVDVE